MDRLVQILMLLFNICMIRAMYRSIRIAIYPRKFSFWEELENTRRRFLRKRGTCPRLPRPKWMERDPLFHLHFDAPLLWDWGKVYYGHILQAEEPLYRWGFKRSGAVTLLYSPDEVINRNPWMLRELCETLYAMKQQPLEEAPANMRPILECLRAEDDRRSFVTHFTLEKGQEVSVVLVTTALFRRHIPRGKLSCKLLPVLAAPGRASSVLILPKKYWSKGFKEKLWDGWKHEI